MNKVIILFLVSCITFYTSLAQILINEYSAANYNTFADNYGEFEDWVELYNPTSASIDLNGWSITDKPSNPTKWTFPSSFIIPANSVAIIFCSGKDELTGGVAHSNFKITQTKGNEILMLTNTNGIFQDSIRIWPNQKSHSRGREFDGSSTWSVFTSGTPNGSNFGAMQEYALKPTFSQTGGYYSGTVNLTLTSLDPNITIYYTTNGDEPDNSSLLYVSGTIIPITVTSVIKAVSYSSTTNIPPSFIDFHTFFVNDNHTIPILSISGTQVDDLLSGFPFTNLEPEGTIEWFDKNGVLLDKGTGEYNKHGNDSWAYGQRGFDYVMRDQFGYNYALKDKLFTTKNRDKFQRIIVKAAANDNFSFEDGAHIRDSYCHHLSQLAKLRMDERSTSACIVYRNGEYWGVYDIREKVDDHDFTDYYYDQDRNNIQYLKTWGNTWSEYGGAQAQTDWDNFVAFVSSNPMTNQNNYNQVKSQYNTGSLIDYFLLNSYIVSSDWLNWNTSWWRGMDVNGDKKKWRYSLWDLDATFDHYINYSWPNGWQSSTTNDPCEAATLLNNPGGQGHVPIWQKLLENQEFHDDYINRWQDLANGALSCDFMINLLDSMVLVIDPEMPRQISTWGGGTYADWQSNVQDLRNFILARCDSMNAGFVDCDTAITGPYNVTVEIIGIGEVEMSNGNIINNTNTPWSDQRFGGITLPFEVKSGAFDHWEIISNNTYIYDPNVDTLLVDLQGDIIVKAFFTSGITITYAVDPIGTSSTITANNVILNTFPYNINYSINDVVNISPNIDPLYGFSSWSSDSVTLMPSLNNPIDSFYATNYDTIKLNLYLLPIIDTARIFGNDTICNNTIVAEVRVNFGLATPPFTFVYAINGVDQPPINTTINPYIINAFDPGTYTLTSFSNGLGLISGSAQVTINQAPIADFEPQPDSMTILYTTTKLVDKSISENGVNITSWYWDFGDNTPADSARSPYHTYEDSIASYQVSLIISDENGCSDTTFKQIQITDDYWMDIPNSFTPDLDGFNDLFCISYSGVREETFIFNIYSRFSELLYTTNNINDLRCIYNGGNLMNGWDGKHYKTGKEVPMGTYVYEVYYQDYQGWKHEENGQIFIIK